MNTEVQLCNKTALDGYWVCIRAKGHAHGKHYFVKAEPDMRDVRPDAS